MILGGVRVTPIDLSRLGPIEVSSFDLVSYSFLLACVPMSY